MKLETGLTSSTSSIFEFESRKCAFMLNFVQVRYNEEIVGWVSTTGAMVSFIFPSYGLCLGARG